MVRSRRIRQNQRRPRGRRNYRRRVRRNNSTAYDVRGRCFRRSILAPYLPTSARPAGNVAGNWLTGLANSVGTVAAMLAKCTVRTFKLTSTSNDATAFPLYTISAVKIDSAYVLGVSQFVTNDKGTHGTSCRFKQVKCHRLHFRMVPSEEIASRGGTLAYTFVPASLATASNDPDYSKLTFTEICAMPGAKYGKASKLHTLTYTPQRGDVMDLWQSVSKPNLFGTFILGFCDLAADEPKTVVNNYLPHTLGIEVETLGDVSLRDPGSETDLQRVAVALSYFNAPESLRVQDTVSDPPIFGDVPADRLILKDGLIVPARKKSWKQLLGGTELQDKSFLSPGSSVTNDVSSLTLEDDDNDFEHV